MRYKLTHRTKYNYFGSVSTYHSLVCLQPRQLEAQICRHFELRISPAPAEIVTRTDYFGNTLHYFSIDVAHKELIVVAESDVESFAKEPVNEPLSMTCQAAKEHIWGTRALKVDLLQYLLPSHFIAWDDEITAFAQRFFLPDKLLYTCVKDLCHAIFTEFKFDSNFTTVQTPLQTVLKEKRGVCQDFSHLAIASLRSMGFPARYVSGYLETLPPPGKKKLQGSDASHAWVSVYIPPFGWCEFDPTNDMIPQERHIVTAYGRDYSDIAPLKGIIFSSGRHTLSVAVDVIPKGR
ncbi:transglutaminase-like putative cysteine protease [Runella defluvii]|uniref:Transglutaminase-like putative cysteine protease n=1 Tax=Runella defluvii TaxID=370973 RepID=A0A7W5ZL36_9BACT|nr:transglutaminase family protein [Runella defluvii]MBB3837761.1 transglutaminase-like putative cysteine protease [Runella defluvii]